MNPRSSIHSPWTRGIARSLFLAFIGILASIPLQFVQLTGVEAAPPPMTRPDMDTRWSAIDAYVEQERQAARVPGIALAIVQGDKVVHLQGFGAADSSGRAVTPQTPFVIGSLTKSVTALAIMQLVEAGKLELDAPVQRYLPWFRVADAEASARITVRHLLTHTSGLPRGRGNSEMATSRDMRDGALEEQVRAFSTAELSEPVGATWQYSNAGYVTLGLLVQMVSGQSYEDYLAEHIFTPLRMEHAFTSPVAAQAAGLATGYRYWFGRPVAFDAPFNRRILPAGLLMASGEDMAHYVIAQLNGGRYADTSLLSPAGIAELQRGAVPIPGGAWGGFEEARYGMGWVSGQRTGVSTVGHPGDASNIHADMILAPEARWGVVLLMNSLNRVAPERMLTIADGVLSLVVGQQPPAAPSSGLMVSIWRGVMALAVVQLLMMIWSALTLRRLARSTAGAVRGWRSIARYGVAPLLLYLLLALVFLGGLPLLFSYPWPLLLLSLPDMGTVALVCGVVALAWAGIRTAVMVRLLRRHAPRVVPATAAPARNVQAT